MKTSNDATGADLARVFEGDLFRVSAATLKDTLCPTKVKKDAHLRLYRCPYGDVFFPPSVEEDLPLDPYFVGIWLGDGAIRQPVVSSSEDEIRLWLQGYVDRINASGAAPHHLHSSLNSRAGDINAAGVRVNVDSYNHYIRVRHGSGDVNVIRRGLQSLGLWESKAGGIPAFIMQGSEATRLKCLAGLIDTDGHLAAGRNQYEFNQFGDERKQISYDLKELALSVGITATGVYVQPRVDHLSGASVAYEVHPSVGGAKLGPYLQLPRKRYDPERRHTNNDVRPATLTVIEDQSLCPIRVSGGLFQLEDRLVVPS